jgi:hypothetical protein
MTGQPDLDAAGCRMLAAAVLARAVWDLGGSATGIVDGGARRAGAYAQQRTRAALDARDFLLRRLWGPENLWGSLLQAAGLQRGIVLARVAAATGLGRVCGACAGEGCVVCAHRGWRERVSLAFERLHEAAGVAG